ncbi:hypothetical protein [Acinetobacter sp. NigerLNRRAM0016]
MGWKNKPTNFTHEIEKQGEERAKRLLTIGIQSVVFGSPVMDGTYRGSHKVSIGQEDYQFDPNHNDLGGASTISKGLAQIVKFKLGDKAFIQTNASHAYALEIGHSKQAPNGVYSIAFINMRNSK